MKNFSDLKVGDVVFDITHCGHLEIFPVEKLVLKSETVEIKFGRESFEIPKDHNVIHFRGGDVCANKDLATHYMKEAISFVRRRYQRDIDIINESTRLFQSIK